MRAPIGIEATASAAFCLLFAAGCAEFELRHRVDSTHFALQHHPGAPEAGAYASALHKGFQKQLYRADAAEFQRRAKEALVALRAHEPTAGPDRPRLVGWRGLLLLDLGRTAQAHVELERSMAMRPTLVAARGLVPLLHRQGRTDDVGETCAASAAAITERVELFELMELCAANMNARDEETALSWATPELRAFYDAERTRRERVAEEEAEQRAMDAQASAATQAAMENAQQMADQAALNAVQMQIAAPFPP